MVPVKFLRLLREKRGAATLSKTTKKSEVSIRKGTREMGPGARKGERSLTREPDLERAGSTSSKS